jgi:hypothetical protein
LEDDVGAGRPWIERGFELDEIWLKLAVPGPMRPAQRQGRDRFVPRDIVLQFERL